MYVTNGDIKALIKWFNKSYNQAKFLCLLVSGHPNDTKFFTDVFNNKESLDIISGEDIAIFLFANDQQESLIVEVGGGSGKVLPGQKILLPGSFGVWQRHISEFYMYKEEIRQNLIKASQSISHNICQSFGISFKELPCILLLGKGETSPFVIPTKGEADSKEFFNFLKELRHIATMLPTTYDLDWSVQAVKPLLLEEQQAATAKTTEEARAELQKALSSMAELLSDYGLPRSVSQEFLNMDTADKVWQIIGLRRDIPQPSEVVQYSEIFKKANEGSELSVRAREVIQASKKLTQANKRLHASEKRLYELRSIRVRMTSIFEKFFTTRDYVTKLCEKYEKKFALKARYRPLREFAESFLGISKKASSVLSLQKSLDNLIPPP